MSVQDKGCYVSGQWKFAHPVTRDELEELARTWKADPGDGRRYLLLAVRGCGMSKEKRDEHGIMFVYRLPEGDTHHNRFFYRITDQLKRRFGNDFFGYDVHSPTTIIE